MSETQKKYIIRFVIIFIILFGALFFGMSKFIDKENLSSLGDDNTQDELSSDDTNENSEENGPDNDNNDDNPSGNDSDSSNNEDDKQNTNGNDSNSDNELDGENNNSSDADGDDINPNNDVSDSDNNTSSSKDRNNDNGTSNNENGINNNNDMNNNDNNNQDSLNNNGNNDINDEDNNGTNVDEDDILSSPDYQSGYYTDIDDITDSLYKNIAKLFYEQTKLINNSNQYTQSAFFAKYRTVIDNTNKLIRTGINDVENASGYKENDLKTLKYYLEVNEMYYQSVLNANSKFEVSLSQIQAIEYKINQSSQYYDEIAVPYLVQHHQTLKSFLNIN